VFIAALVALSGYDIYRAYNTAIENTGRELDTQAKIIAEQTARSLQAVDVVLRHLVQQHNHGVGARLNESELHTQLADLAVGFGQIDGFAVIGPDGRLRGASYIEVGKAAQVSVADVPTFQYLAQNRHQGVLIDTARLSNFDGRWLYPIARRLETPAGSFAGVVAARGRIDYFQDFYRDINMEPGTRTALVHRNGTLLARFPPAPEALGKPLAGPAALLATRSADGPPLRTKSPIDGADRIGVVKPVPDYPLVVVVTRDAQAVLAPWRAQSLRTGARTIGLAAIAVALLVLLMRQFSRLLKTRESLASTQQRYALAVAGSDDGIWEYDFTTGRAFASARARELSGLPPGPEEEPINAFMQSLPVHPDDKPIREAALESHLAGRAPSYEGEWRIRGADGAYRWVRVHGLCVRDAAGKPQRMAGSISDIDARKRAEEALRASEERYALAVAGSDDGIWDYDFASGRVFASPRARELSGLPPGPEMLPASEWLKSLPIHPDDKARWEASREAHLSGETPAYEGEWRMRHADGTYRWVRVHGLCLRDAAGRPYRMAGSISDIDDRKRAEEALRASEEHYRAIFNAAADALVLRDANAKVVDVNPAFLQISGYTRDEVVSGTRWIFALPEMAELAKEMHRRCIAGETVRFEMKARRKDGTLIDIEMRAVPIRYRGQQHALGMARDITAQKRAEEALRASEEQYRAIFNAAADALVLRDAQAHVVDVNPAFLQISGYERDEVVNQSWFFPPAEATALAREMHRRTIAGESMHFEMRARRKDGALIDVEVGAVPIRYRGKPHALERARDITAQKHAEAERVRLEGQLLQAKKLEAIGTLAGGIAHDFNNILSATLGYGEMAQKAAPSGTALRRHIDAVVSAGMRAKSLVERILAFSRSGIGERVPVHVQSVVAEALDLLAPSLPAHVRLERQLGAGDAAVMGDPTQIHQVVMNLCANGAQAMKSPGALTVSLDVVERADSMATTGGLVKGRYVRLQVSDSGSGIAPGVLERIFDPFFTTKGVGVGTGLGLSLVHGIVTDLGGGIDVESEAGAGTTFTVYLPWTAASAAPAGKEEAIVRGSGEAILLVDDEESLVRLGEEMIADLGYEPVGFASSVAALEAFRAEPERFSAVLSDEAMPEMTGTELAQEIRALRADVPIVLMTGFIHPTLAARAQAAGVRAVLAKPLVARDIARALAAVLRQRQPNGVV
jgi:PAS domain S-box-containing protein